MVDHKAELYEHPQETWDAKKCAKLAKRTVRDGMGTKHHRKGYLGSPCSPYPIFGPQRYNGGCIRKGKWYQGENKPFPKLAEGFEIISVPTWGWYIVVTESVAKA